MTRSSSRTPVLSYYSVDHQALVKRHGAAGAALIEVTTNSGYFVYPMAGGRVAVSTDERDHECVFADANAAHEWLLTQLV